MPHSDDPHAARGLFGWPRVAGNSPRAAFEAIGVPSDAANSFASGARFAPEAIRRASLALPTPDANGIDRGDLACIGNVDWQDAIGAIRSEIEAIRARDAVPIVLGGDHSISFPAVAALAIEGPVNVVWFDAHTDMCEWRESDWHNHKQVLRRIAGLPHVSRILLIGHRGIAYFDESRGSEKTTLITAGRIDDTTDTTMLDILPTSVPVYMSIDIDVLDPRWAPGTGHPVPGGLSPALLSRLARTVVAHRRVTGMDLMEVNPPLDHGGITVDTAARILAELLSVGARSSRTVPSAARAVASSSP